MTSSDDGGGGCRLGEFIMSGLLSLSARHRRAQHVYWKIGVVAAACRGAISASTASPEAIQPEPNACSKRSGTWFPVFLVAAAYTLLSSEHVKVDLL